MASGSLSLPFLELRGKVSLVNSAIQCTRVCREIIASGATVCGFDAEWPAERKKGTIPIVSMVQVTIRAPNSEGMQNGYSTFLFHLAAMPQRKPPQCLAEFITSTDIKKTGVNVSGDISRLARVYDLACDNVYCNGSIDLSEMASTVWNCKERWSLDALVQRLLSCRLDKSSELRLGDWEQIPLADDMAQYAALDSFASLRVYEELAKIQQNSGKDSTCQTIQNSVGRKDLDSRWYGTAPSTIIPEGVHRLLAVPVLPEKTLLGPGPTNLPPEVLEALQWPTQGHLHPEFVKVMDDCRVGLQYAFGTTAAATMAISGTGHSGMEAAMLNLLEKGDKLLVVRNGIWGQRAAALGERLGIDVHCIDVPLGQAVSLDEFEKSLATHKPAVAFVCHGESSTGVLHPLENLGPLCRQHGTLLLVDTVASLCAAPFRMDELQVDCVYAATQKALSAPCGLAPISFGDRAWEKVMKRRTPVPSFYMDAKELANYWNCFGEPRRYHHTGPIQSIFGLRAALGLLAREGVDNCVARHQKNATQLWEGLEAIGLSCFVKDKALRNPAITTVSVPQGVDPAHVIAELMDGRRIEIAGGLGATAGKVWRIGLMGHNSRDHIVKLVLQSLEMALAKHKHAHL